MSRQRSRRPDRKPPEAASPPAALSRFLRLPTPPWWAVALLAGLVVALLLADDLAFVWGNPQFLDHAGNLLLTAADGYHYLYLADAAQRVGAPGFALPGLSFLALHLSSLLGAGLLPVAFWLPPLLGLLLGPAMVLVARSLGLSRGAALLAALAACAAPYWHARSNLGYFDTDCLIPPLVLLAGWGLLRFTLGKVRRWVGLILCAACLAYLRWWWGPSALPLAGGFAAAYALTVFAPSARWERTFKAALLAACLALAGLFLLRHALPLPAGLGQFFHFVAEHLRLVTHQQAAPVQVGATIGELKAVGVLGLGEITVAQAWVLVPALAGLVLLAVGQWPGMIQLLPVLGLAGLSLASVRFAVFLGPVLGLGLGALADRGWAWAGRLGQRAPTARVAVVLLGLGLVGPAVQQDFRLKFPPPFTAQETVLAETLGREAAARGESGSVAWLWWDYGYLVSYYARMEPLFHGGSQDPDSCFRAAFPLALADPPLAAGWMRALARGGGSTLELLRSRLGGEPQALEFLARSLPAPQDFPALAAAAGLPDQDAWRTRLFPAAPVYLYLPLPLLDRLPVLWGFSLAHVPGAPPAAPEFLAKPRGRVQVDPASGMAVADGRQLPLSLAVQVLPQGVQVAPLGRPGHILVDVAGLPRLYLLSQDYGRSLLFRLLFTAPRDTPGFACLAYDSRVGGVWRVE